jgi:hypothetical protein
MTTTTHETNGMGITVAAVFSRSNKTSLIIWLACLAIWAASAGAATLNVPADYSTIQAAVNAASAGRHDQRGGGDV